MVWSNSNRLHWATVGEASGVSPVGTVASDSRMEDWGIVRAGNFVYLLQRTNATNEFRLYVYDIADGTWSAATSPGVSGQVSGQVSGNDGIPLAAHGDDVYAFYTWDGIENVGSGEDRIVRYQKYTGPGAAGTWGAATDVTVGGRLNGDHITTPSTTAGEPIVIGWVVDDDDVQGTGQAIEYYTVPVAAALPRAATRTNEPTMPARAGVIAVVAAAAVAAALTLVTATHTPKATGAPKR